MILITNLVKKVGYNYKLDEPKNIGRGNIVYLVLYST